MPKPIDLDRLLANNPGVDAEQLKKRLEASQRFRGTGASRYRYNLLPPFARRLRQHPPAAVGGPDDNVRKPS